MTVDCFGDFEIRSRLLPEEAPTNYDKQKCSPSPPTPNKQEEIEMVVPPIEEVIKYPADSISGHRLREEIEEIVVEVLHKETLRKNIVSQWHDQMLNQKPAEL